jgi:hypothetical protein
LNPEPNDRPALNESHVRHLVSNLRYADKLLSEMEAVLTAGTASAAFAKYIADLTPAQSRMVEGYIARLRSQMIRVLESVGISTEPPRIGSIHALRVHLSFVRIALQECAPHYLGGYGRVPVQLIPELEGVTAELRLQKEN